MATKSPGIYFHEIDNTQFENPKAATGTTLAIVGYAKKGPIGIPVLVNSWSEFVSTFGKPVDGFYSGLAAYTFISAKGAVLFTRVADETLAKASSLVLKNGKAAVDGTIKFTNSEAVIKSNTPGYVPGEHYCFKIAKEAGDKGKYFFIETPEDHLKKSEIVSAISEQMGATPAKWEAVLGNIAPGLYAFNIETKGANILNEDFFIEAGEGSNKKTFIENLSSRVSNGSNARVEISFSKEHTYGDGTPSAYAEDFSFEGLKGRRKFRISRKKEINEVVVNLDAAKLTLKEIAKALNKKLAEEYDINVFAVQGEDKVRNSKLVFVSSLNDDDFQILSYTDKKQPNTPAVQGEDLFAWQNGETSAATQPNFAIGTGEDGYINVIEHKVVGSQKTFVSRNFTIDEFDELKGTFTISTPEKGSGQEIKLSESKFAETNPELSLIKSKTIGTVYSINGQDALEGIAVGIDFEDNKVKLTSVGSVIPPAISAIDESDEEIGGGKTVYKDFLKLMVEPGSKDQPGYDKPVSGTPAIEDTARDMVIFTSREKGSGTNNIKLEIWSRLDYNTKQKSYGIDIYVDGLRKQSYEDLSLKYAVEDDDVKKRFDFIINESPENGGSPYIKVDIKKNDFKDPNVQLKEGIYNIGKKTKDGDVAKAPEVPDNAYEYYNYSVGDDGIPSSGGSYLFEDAMKPGTSALANKELYDFHILIAPDDISQEVQTAQIKLCEDREDAITIVDPPIGLNKKAVIDWHNGRGYGRNVAIESNYAATYWPWCKIVDTSNGLGRYTWVMPSIIMAAQYVRVDKSVGAHMAPAGEQNGRLGVIDIEQYPNQLDRDELYVDYNRVNPITKFKDGSIIAYGEKTTQRTNSVLTKIHTRRMLVQIKKECREALRGYIFMPNTVSYLTKIGNNISGILEYYKKKGGINFYKVICDETNNPVEVRQQDIINVDAVIVPEGTIEQINISLTLNKTAETVTG